MGATLSDIRAGTAQVEGVTFSGLQESTADGVTTVKVTATLAEGTYRIASIVHAEDVLATNYELASTHTADDTVLSARFVNGIVVELPPEKATLTFDLAGGALEGKTDTVSIEAPVGESVGLPGAPARDGYSFMCWRDSKGSEYAAGAEYTVPEGGHAFTAIWEKSTKRSSNNSRGKAKSALPATSDSNAVLNIMLVSFAALGLLCVFVGCASRRKACHGKERSWTFPS